MPEQSLHRPDIVAVFQQVGGEGVAESVRRDPFGDASLLGGLFDGLLHSVLVKVMTTNHGTVRIYWRSTPPEI